MDVIFAPWRMAYVRKSERTEGCIFCKGRSRSDDLMLREGRTAFVMMNRYPYTTGHLMVIPFRHVGEIAGLTKEERVEMFDLLDVSTDALRQAMNPDGFNIGIPDFVARHSQVAEGTGWIGAALVIVLMLLVMTGAKLTGRVLAFIVAAKLVAVLLVIAVGATHVKSDNYSPFVPKAEAVDGLKNKRQPAR